MIRSVGDKFLHDIGDIYDAEHRFLAAQQELLAQAANPAIKAMLETHITETRSQIINLEQIYTILGATPERITCDAAIGLVKEGDKSVGQVEDPMLRDSTILSAVAKVEHYEIATYRDLLATAEHTGKAQLISLLQNNLAQEEKTAHEAERVLRTQVDGAIAQQRIATA